MTINFLKNKQIIILGLGVTGKVLYNLLENDHNLIIVNDNQVDGYPVIGLDELNKKNINVDVILKSPGIKDHPLLSHYPSAIVMNDIEIAYLYIKENKLPIQIIGITGTNGKTTTTEVINLILNKSGYKSFVAGNIGISPLQVISQENEIDYLVLELSSYQLKDIKYFKTDFSLILNLTPDHIDYHESIENYMTSKLNLLNNLDDSRVVVHSQIINDHLNKLTNNYQVEKDIHFNFPIQIPLINAQLIYTLCQIIKIDHQIILNVLSEFNGIEHRYEKIGLKHGITFINDSKATNTQSTNMAIDNLKVNTVLLIGGSLKNEDYKLLHYQNKFLKQIIVYGSNQDQFDFIDNLIKCESLEIAFAKALQYAQFGEQVLLSPASASFDQFTNYEERGKLFKKLYEEVDL